MSTTIGKLLKTGSRGVDMEVVRYWGGDTNGVCVQITARMEEGEDGYVQLRASDIVALLPLLKSEVLDMELKRRKVICEKLVAENKALEKTIISDMEKVAGMAIGQPILEVACLLSLGTTELVPDRKE